jgi:hypothetical protein
LLLSTRPATVGDLDRAASERRDAARRDPASAGRSQRRAFDGKVKEVDEQAYVSRSKASRGRSPRSFGAYDAVAGLVKANGRELAGPPREIYLDKITGDKPHMEIAWPIR